MEKWRAAPAYDAPDTAQHRALAAASRVRMLGLIRSADMAVTADEISAASGLHPSTVRAHLQQLTDAGLLVRERQPEGTPGRPAWRYRATAQPETHTGSPYRDLAAALIGQMARTAEDPHAAGVAAGRAWGRELAAQLGRVRPMDGVLGILRRLGFDPAVTGQDADQATVVRLRACPFLALAASSPDIVCGAHQGVIGGALGALGALGATTSLEPFATPEGCIARIRLAQMAG